MNTFPVLNRESGKKEKETLRQSMCIFHCNVILNSIKIVLVKYIYINHIVSASLFLDYELSISA